MSSTFSNSSQTHYRKNYGGINWQPVNQMEQVVQHINQLESNLVDNLSINQSFTFNLTSSENQSGTPP